MARARAVGSIHNGRPLGILAMYSNNYHTLTVDLAIPINGSVAFLRSLVVVQFHILYE
jgi:hypothetical protein